jgi:hypothetical protein
MREISLLLRSGAAELFHVHTSRSPESYIISGNTKFCFHNSSTPFARDFVLCIYAS